MQLALNSRLTLGVAGIFFTGMLAFGFGVVGMPTSQTWVLPVIAVVLLGGVVGLAWVIKRYGHPSYESVAWIVFLFASTLFTFWSQGERSPYTWTSAMFPASSSWYGVFGYNYAIGDTPFMSENMLWVEQTRMFNGAPAGLSMYFSAVRAVYGYLASVFAPFFGMIGGLLALNYAGWVVAAWVAWRFTLDLARDKLAACLAVGFVALGLGYVIHINDYSPHTIPFVTYYVGLWLIYATRVWAESRPLKTHLLLGVYLALAALGYNTGISLIAGYVLVAVWRNRWWQVALAAAIGLSAQYLWIGALNVLNAFVTGKWVWINVSGHEQNQLADSLKVWFEALPHPAKFLELFLSGLAQFAWFECLPIVALGLLAWFLVRRPRAELWFFVVFAGLPIAAGMAYLFTSTTRGYIIYGISLLFYAPLATLLARGLRASAPRWRAALVALTALIFAAQLFWSAAFAWGYLFPAKAFFNYGSLNWIPNYIGQFQMPRALSLTGLEPTPVMFGGAASLSQAGLYIKTDVPAISYKWQFGLASRAFVSLYVLAFVALIVSRRRLFMALTFASVIFWLLPATLPQVLPPREPPVLMTLYNIRLTPGTTMRYSVNVSDAFLAELRALENQPVKVEFMYAIWKPPFDVTVRAGEQTVLAQNSEWAYVRNAAMPLADVLNALAHEKKINIDLKTLPVDAGGYKWPSVFGWQRNGLAGRAFYDMATHQAWTGENLPAFEMRVLDLNGKLLLTGY